MLLIKRRVIPLAGVSLAAAVVVSLAVVVSAGTFALTT
jgi:hypothetical protein